MIPVKSHLYSRCTRFLSLKRIFDIFTSIIGLLLSSPLFAIIALTIKFSSSGEVLFKHKRVGCLGREFDVYKFRTMIQDAEEHMKYFTPEQAAEFKENYKLKNDPRITPIGKFLRKSSLDELPQLINVLKGDMSIVGPRPITKAELCKYENHADTLFSVRPGITGLWQVSGRNDITYDERVMLDINYINSASLLLDIKIILKTFVKVILREGVY